MEVPQKGKYVIHVYNETQFKEITAQLEQNVTLVFSDQHKSPNHKGMSLYIIDNFYDGFCWIGWEKENDTYSDYKVLSYKISTMDLKEKVALAFKSEPEKSFIKAGVMNADESLTQDGKDVLLSFLLKKYGKEFKKEVVDVILAEDTKEE